MSRLSNARDAVAHLFAMNAHSRNAEAFRKLEATLDELEAAVMAAAVTEITTAVPLLNEVSEGTISETEPQIEGSGDIPAVSDVVGTDTNGSPIVAEIPPPSNEPVLPIGSGKSKAKTANKE